MRITDINGVPMDLASLNVEVYKIWGKKQQKKYANPLPDLDAEDAKDWHLKLKYVELDQIWDDLSWVSVLNYAVNNSTSPVTWRKIKSKIKKFCPNIFPMYLELINNWEKKFKIYYNE